MKKGKKIFLNDNTIIDTVLLYYKNVENQKLKFLTRDEEYKLGKKQNLSKKNALITTNLKFVVMVAKRYGWSGMDLSDLIQAGNIGLIKAANKFDGKKGRFLNYAVWCIRNTIFNTIRGNIITMPQQALLKVLKYKKTL